MGRVQGEAVASAVAAADEVLKVCVVWVRMLFQVVFPSVSKKEGVRAFMDGDHEMKHFGFVV